MSGSIDPPSPEEIGRAGWTVLHTTAAAFPHRPTDQQRKDMRDFIRSWSRVYPCSICAYHMRQQLLVMPPDVTDKRSFSRWTCELHNSVNTLLDKEVVDCDPEKVLRRWHPTYPYMDDEPTPEELIARHQQQQQQQQSRQQPKQQPASASASAGAPPTSSSTLSRGAMLSGWGAKSDGGGTGVPDNATDTDAVLRRLVSCKAFCPEAKKTPDKASAN
jgi:hypothetical protein